VHAAARDPSGFIDLADWLRQWSPQMWLEALDSGIRDAALTERIRQATRTGRVAGSDEFVARLEAATGRRLRPLKRGPKKKTLTAADQNFEVV
jgi:hypothetical protein